MTPEEHDLLIELVDGQQKMAARLEQVVGMIMSVDARLDRLALRAALPRRDTRIERLR